MMAKIEFFLNLLVLDSSLIDFNDSLSNQETELATLKNESIINCLTTGNCFEIKTANGTNYVSFSSTEFSGDSNNRTLCTATACDLLKCKINQKFKIRYSGNFEVDYNAILSNFFIGRFLSYLTICFDHNSVPTKIRNFHSI